MAKQDNIICPICNKAFNDRGFLLHLRMVHQKTSEEALAAKATAKREPLTPIPLPESQVNPPIHVHVPEKDEQSQIQVKPIVEKISNIKEDFEMDERSMADLIATRTTKAVADALEAERREEQARLAENAKRQEIKKKMQERADNYHNMINGIKDNLNTLNVHVKEIENNVVQKISEGISPKIDTIVERQQTLHENLVALKSSLPDNFCSSYPDLCSRLGAVEQLLEARKLPAGEAAALMASEVFNCPDCKPAFTNEAKKHLYDIIGDDTALLKKLALDKGFNMTETPKKKDILSF